jgi:hypothetical protein
LAQEWQAAYRPVALLLKSSPIDKVELSQRMHMIKRHMVLWAVSLLAVSMPAIAKEVRISFPKGSTETEVKGSITDYATVDYILRAGKGQTLKVAMASDTAKSI